MKKQVQFFVQLLVVTSIFLSLCHCSTKNLSTQKSRKAIHNTEDISIQSSERGFLQGSRLISMSDSVDNQYYIKISPLDTFSFSLQNGFKGKATMIEVVGTSQEVRKIIDSSSFRADRQNETQYDRKSRTKETTASRHKKLEKKKSTLLLNILVLGVSVLVIGICWRLWKQRIGDKIF